MALNRKNPIITNPMIKSAFIQPFLVAGLPIPPSSSFIITENDDYIIDENGERLITE